MAFIGMLMNRKGVFGIYCTEVMNISYLSDLVPNETAFIYNVAECELSRRLWDLGFAPGTKVECVAKAPFGGPSAYLIRGTVIALRREDAHGIGVQRSPAASGQKAYSGKKYGRLLWG